MYRRLTNSILFCRLTHRCIVVYDISCNFHCPFLDITFHENSPHSLLFYNLCREFLMYVCIILANDYLPQHFFIFFTGATGAGIVSSDFWLCPHIWRLHFQPIHIIPGISFLCSYQYLRIIRNIFSLPTGFIV